MPTRKDHSDKPRDNQQLGVVHTNAAALLKRFAQGNASKNDRALAGIMANQLDRRKH